MNNSIPLKKPSGRKPGGQPGNQNALKHGLYSKHISLREDEALDQMAQDKNQDELALARVRLGRCLLKQAATVRHSEWLAYEHAIQGYLEKIANMTHQNAILGTDKRSSFTTVLEMIRVVNRWQHVR